MISWIDSKPRKADLPRAEIISGNYQVAFGAWAPLFVNVEAWEGLSMMEARRFCP